MKYTVKKLHGLST